MKRLGCGRVVVLGLLLLAIGAVVAQQLGYVERARNRLWPRPLRLSAGDFPAGVAAPVDDWASLPDRATVVGVVPHGAIAPMLWAAGDGETVGLYRAAYALQVSVRPFEKEDALRQALMRGGDNGGVDFAALPVSTLAMTAASTRDAAPRVVLLLGRSRGQEVLVSAKPLTLQGLAGKRLGLEPRSASSYFALWVLSRVGFTLADVKVVPLDSALDASKALREGRVDAAAGYLGDLSPTARELGGDVIASTSDAPHLLATVLVVRGDFAARYPDAVRRVVRGTLDADAQVLKDTTAAARLLGKVAPRLGDPTEAIRATPPATLRDNLAFFGLAGESPVGWAEQYRSAAALATRLYGAAPAPDPEDAADLGALKYVSGVRGP